MPSLKVKLDSGHNHKPTKTFNQFRKALYEDLTKRPSWFFCYPLQTDIPIHSDLFKYFPITSRLAPVPGELGEISGRKILSQRLHRRWRWWWSRRPWWHSVCLRHPPDTERPHGGRDRPRPSLPPTSPLSHRQSGRFMTPTRRGCKSLHISFQRFRPDNENISKSLLFF